MAFSHTNIIALTSQRYCWELAFHCRSKLVAIQIGYEVMKTASGGRKDRSIQLAEITIQGWSSDVSCELHDLRTINTASALHRIFQISQPRVSPASTTTPSTDFEVHTLSIHTAGVSYLLMIHLYQRLVVSPSLDTVNMWQGRTRHE